MADSLDLIAPDRREAARAALREAFGPRAPRDLRLLKGGVSGAAIYQVRLGERFCVLRLEPRRIPLHHRERGFACMRAAAQAGVAPAVHYADAAAAVAIMDFVEARPLAEHPGGPAGLVRELGGLVARLQAAPLFPPLHDGGDIVAFMLAALGAAGSMAPGLLAAHAEGLARLRAVIPWDPSSLVSSHNDPNPRNMLFDGARVWLVDWELGFRNAPLFDLAILSTELAPTPQLQDVLLAAALGRAPDAPLRARLAVTRLLTRLYYGCVVLESLADARAAPETSLDALTPTEFAAAAAGGALAPGSPEIARAFGKMSLAAFLAGLRDPALDETLSLAAQG
jgi:Ser/Thr protein kinase RdoA (MazF antagonist)